MPGSEKQRSQSSNLAATRRQLLLGLPALCLAAPAFADETLTQEFDPIQLPDDPALAVLVRIKGKFTSLYNKQARVFYLPTTLCHFPFGDPVTVETMDENEIGRMPSPLLEGWGAFAPAEKTFLYTFDITDSLGRMSRVLVRDMETNVLLATFRANTAGTILHGQVKLSADTRRNYAVVGTDKKNRILFRLATNYGNADRFVCFTFDASFEPNRSVCAPCNGQPDRAIGPTGDPLSIAGIRAFNRSDSGPMREIKPAYDNISILEVYKTEVNDSEKARGMAPPDAIKRMARRQILRDTVRPDIEKYAYSAYSANSVSNRLKEIRKTDATLIFSEITMPPYSKNCGRWRGFLVGTAFAFLAVPYNRFKNCDTQVNALLHTCSAPMQPEVKPLTDLLVAAAKAEMKNPKYGEEGKWIADEVIPLGDIYILQAQARSTDITSRPVVANVDFKVTASPADPAHPLPFEGSVELLGPDTTPSPPPIEGMIGFTLSGNEKGKAHANLPKGWKWKFTGKVDLPQYEAGVVPFNTPSPNLVEAVSKKKP